MDRYTKGKLLGKGSYGSAYLATDVNDGKDYVIKEIDVSRMPRQEREVAAQEAQVLTRHQVRSISTVCQNKRTSDLFHVQVLKSLNHPNVVRCKETFTDSGRLCIVMEYCSEGQQTNRHKLSVHHQRASRGLDVGLEYRSG